MIAFDPRLFDQPEPHATRRRQIVRVLQAALRAVDPAAAVRQQLQREGDLLWVQDRAYDLSAYDRVLVAGAGKAGAPMAQAVEEVLGNYLTEGLVNVKYEHALPTRCIEINEAGHPLPDDAGVRGARHISALLAGVGARDLVICLISGGGSALMTLPVEGVTLADMQGLTSLLLKRGATINEINTLRKHLEQLKGGQLARLAHPATVISLILSDVVGNPLDVIASGPTVPDTSTFADGAELLERYDLLTAAPPAIVAHLQRGARGELADTPKAGDPVFERAYNVIVASNDIAARAALRAAGDLGFETLLLSTYVQGEAREVAGVYAAIAREMVASGAPLAAPACVVAGGETTVTIRGDGLGGRNQELALAAALALQGLDDVVIVCLATDGSDGPTDAAGALADGTTLARGAALGLSARDHLARNDSYHYLLPLGDLLLTGPTHTNVNDLTFIFVW